MDRAILTAESGSGRSTTGRRGARPAWATACAGLALAAGVALIPAEATAAQSAAPCRAGTGPYQWKLEKHLGLVQDGRQSEADCLAIRAFQERYRIRPATGRADLRTYRKVLIVQAGRTPNKARRCPQRSATVVCVDQSRQLLWVQKGAKGKVLFRPVPVRTGIGGVETRRGMHRIVRRVRHEVSALYNNARMPYSQYFSGGQALHGTYSNIYDGGGSHGCVNLRLKDAARLWKLLDVGDRVYVFGRKPGTRSAHQPLTDDELIATTRWGQ